MNGAIDCATKSSPAGVMTTMSTLATVAGPACADDSAGSASTRDAMIAGGHGTERDVIVRVLRAPRQQQVLRIVAVDENLDRRRFPPLDTPVAPLARRVDDRDRLARCRRFEDLIDQRPGGAWPGEHEPGDSDQ